MAKEENRTEFMQFRATPSEAVKIEHWAKESGMKVGDYLRKVVMRGVTYRVEEVVPKEIIVESVTLEPEGLGGVQQKQRRHGAG